MIVDLGGKIQADSRELVAIVRLTDRGDRLVREARRQNRIVAGAQEDAKSAVLLAGARRPGGITENARLCLSGVSAGRLAARVSRRLRGPGREARRAEENE